MHFTKEDIKALGKIKRLNLINSITGIKPANLIGTKSKNGISNLAVFSSIVHFGSKPAIIGFNVRPTGENRRDTYQNVMDTEYFTINHVHTSFIKKAHYTSAKFDAGVSEFDTCGFNEEYLVDFHAPYVKESQLKFGLKLVEILDIKVNGTKLILGEIEHIFLPENIMSENGQLDLDEAETAGISGLNVYYSLNRMEEFPYARVSENPFGV